MIRRYAFTVGLLLGVMQTGYFFQLTFTLSSGFGTYLLVTLCWLIGSVLGVAGVAHIKQIRLWFLLALSLIAYGIVMVMLDRFPFDTDLWIVYGALVMISGLLPGVFFVHMGQKYRVQTVFLWENNGFLAGLIAGTVLFLLMGRGVLWGFPIMLAIIVALFDRKS